MKKILFSLVAIMLLGSTVPMEAQRHRHTPRTTVVDDTKGRTMALRLIPTPRLQPYS